MNSPIALFAPDRNLRGVRAKAVRQRNSYFPVGEGPRTVLDALRVAGQPFTTREVTERAMADRGIELTPERIDAVQKSVVIILSKLLGKKGKLVRVVGTDKTGVRSWQIA